MKAINKCNVCEDNNFNVKVALKDFQVAECNGCGLERLALNSDDVDFEQFYSSDYYNVRKQYYFENSIVNNNGGREDDNIKSFKNMLDYFESIDKKGNILDLGCALGIFLSMAKHRGWNIFGVDISPYATKFAREKLNINAKHGMLRDQKFEDNFFDVVTMFDVFEHFTDPLDQLMEVHRILKDDGILFLNTPNKDALLRRLANMAYRLSGKKISYPVKKLYHKYHLFYYSEANLIKMLRSHGFELVSLKKQSIPIVKARGTNFEKLIVKSISYLEKFLHMEFEIALFAKKYDKNRSDA